MSMQQSWDKQESCYPKFYSATANDHVGMIALRIHPPSTVVDTTTTAAYTIPQGSSTLQVADASKIANQYWSTILMNNAGPQWPNAPFILHLISVDNSTQVTVYNTGSAMSIPSGTTATFIGWP